MSLILWIVIIILILLLIYFGVGLYAALTFSKVGEHPQYSDDPGKFGLDFEKVCFKARVDSLKIAAWYLPNPRSSKVIILVHGRNASKQNAISGTLPRLAAELHQAGLAVLMIDLRGHGESEGNRYMWGVKERWDVLGAVDFLVEKGFEPGNIALLGISLGGAAAIGATIEDPAIGALVVESTFADLNTLVKPKWKEESGLPFFFLPGVFWMWHILFGFNLRHVKPVEEISLIPPRPILIMHCQVDKDVDVSHAHRLKESVPNAKLVLFDDCSHAEIYRDHPQEYLEVLLTFLQKAWHL
ncbi:MAG: alpha/beta hydrolase [Anaerolineales bacterium]|jgi:pimeloyl-ACP methyl ester carboxylesterase